MRQTTPIRMAKIQKQTNKQKLAIANANEDVKGNRNIYSKLYFGRQFGIILQR